MFGFSLFKIIFTIAIVIVVWNAFKFFTRLQNQREQNPRVKPRPNASSGRASAAPEPASKSGSGTGEVEDMVECKVCHAYVTRGAKSCGKDNCPFQG